MKKTEDEKHEAKVRRLAKELRESPDWENVHTILDAEDDLKLKVMNEVLREHARRKIN